MMNLAFGLEMDPSHALYEARPSCPAVQAMAGQEFGFHSICVL